jgi:hypothetical protein
MRARLAPLLVAALAMPLSGSAGLDAAPAPGADSIGPGAGLERCGGTAPGVTHCTTGEPTPLGPVHAGLQLAFPGYPPLHHGVTPMWNVGCSCTVESKFTWLPFGLSELLSEAFGGVHGMRIYRCNLQRGFIYDCDEPIGDFPPFGPFVLTHECRAYEFRTTTPGGVGPWECYIEHG